MSPQFFFKVLHGLSVFFHQIPLIDDNNGRFSLFVCISGNLGILFGKAFGCINHNQTNICPVNCHIGTQDAILFNFFRYLGFSPDSGGINQDELALFIFHSCIRCVTGCSGNIRHNHTLFPSNAVDQRRLADIRFPNNGDPNRIVLFFQFRFWRQSIIDRIQHITAAMTMFRRNRKRIAQSQIIELIEFHRRFTDFITFIDC